MISFFGVIYCVVSLPVLFSEFSSCPMMDVPLLLGKMLKVGISDLGMIKAKIILIKTTATTQRLCIDSQRKTKELFVLIDDEDVDVIKAPYEVIKLLQKVHANEVGC